MGKNVLMTPKPNDEKPNDDIVRFWFRLVSGFGMTESHSTANYLRYIRLPVVDQQVCHTSMETARLKYSDVYPLTENMFCAGYIEGGNDTCQGDSGSGFVTKSNGAFYATGIVSWGVACGLANHYGVYTRVARYTNWIQQIMAEN